MKILVRLPNWLGDLVMSAGFCRELQQTYPDAEVHCIVRDTLADLAALLPGVRQVVPFLKKTDGGLPGAIRFGRKVQRTGPYEIFFSLPESFSSALIGFFSGSRHRIGYRGQWRSLLLTHAYEAPAGIHRTQRYAALLDRYSGSPVQNCDTCLEIADRYLKTDDPVATGSIVVNINSEASSRRMSPDKWAEVIKRLMAETGSPIILIGSEKERVHTDALGARIGKNGTVRNLAGKTSLVRLAALLVASRLLVSTDSGPAHLASALGVPTVVLFGAGDDRVTAPYEKRKLRVIRQPDVACAPCVSNVCRYGDQHCLEQIPVERIVTEALTLLNQDAA